MPYTPPSHQSPASSRSTTPTISRSSSYVEDLSGRGHLSPRPNLPRSVSSAAYLNKHRRSPSITRSTEDGYEQSNTHSTEPSPSIRQSPPPLNNLVIPTGAIISPPESSENSDGDDKDAQRQHRGRELDTSWGELQQAVRSMSLKRDPSPVKQETPAIKTNGVSFDNASEPTTSMTSPSALSPEARKISHSRSNTENAISAPHQTYPESTNHTSDESEEEEYRSNGKPPLVRKKSGELVKPALRPSSRRRYSSMPGTPTYSKSVHFNDNGNQTRHFLQVDKPMAVSAGSSPAETYESETEYPFDDGTSGPRIEWDMKMANFPVDTAARRHQPVYIERFFLSSDTKSLIGTVAVANLAFNKSVTARFTLDYWKTTSEVNAEYSHDVRKVQADDGHDRFNFTIRLSDQANLESKTLLLCVRYNVNGQEYWDSNNGTNYQIDFVKKQVKKVKHVPQSTLGARPLNAIPRSRHSPPATARGRAPSIDEDIVNRFDSGSSAYHFGSPDQILGDSFVDSSSKLKLKPRTKRGVAGNAPPQVSNGLGGRYDFGASLSAALSTAQDKLGKQSGLMAHQGQKTTTGYFSQDPAREVTPIPDVQASRPDTMTTDRPAMGSAQYRDLVSKFCYVGSRATASS